MEDTYPNKTIMEVKPQQSARKAWCNWEDLINCFLDNDLGIRACFLIESYFQTLRLSVRKIENESKKDRFNYEKKWSHVEFFCVVLEEKTCGNCALVGCNGMLRIIILFYSGNKFEAVMVRMSLLGFFLFFFIDGPSWPVTSYRSICLNWPYKTCIMRNAWILIIWEQIKVRFRLS